MKTMMQLKLKSYLEEKNITIYWLHEITNIRYKTLHSIINNRVTKVNLEYLDAIMDALNISDMNIVLEKQDSVQQQSG